MHIEELGIQVAEQEFLDLLRELKYDFRKTLTELEYLQEYSEVFIHQKALIEKLLFAYKRQLEHNHISKGEFVRLQTLELELTKNIYELRKEKNEVQKTLRILLNIDQPVELEVLNTDFRGKMESLRSVKSVDFLNRFLDGRPDIRLSDLEVELQASNLSLEKAQAIPDVSLLASYDRGGGIWPSFFGFGLSIDLPVFNRNQGQIAFAKSKIESSNIHRDETRLKARSEVIQTFNDYQNALDFYESMDDNYESDLDEIFDNYTQNFSNRNVSLLQYLDFQEAYLENKKII